MTEGESFFFRWFPHIDTRVFFPLMYKCSLQNLVTRNLNAIWRKWGWEQNHKALLWLVLQQHSSRPLFLLWVEKGTSGKISETGYTSGSSYSKLGWWYPPFEQLGSGGKKALSSSHVLLMGTWHHHKVHSIFNESYNTLVWVNVGKQICCLIEKDHLGDWSPEKDCW